MSPIYALKVTAQDASQLSPFRGFLGTSNWEETLGRVQNQLEKLHISSDRETPQDPQEELDSNATG